MKTAPSLPVIDSLTWNSTSQAFTIVISNTNRPIRRVKYYDNGVFFGEDRHYPFGDNLENGPGLAVVFSRGNHSITAEAYDDCGNVGKSDPNTPLIMPVDSNNEAPYGLNARPEVQVLLTAVQEAEYQQNGLLAIARGDMITLNYSAFDPDNDLTIVKDNNGQLNRVVMQDVAINDDFNNNSDRETEYVIQGNSGVGSSSNPATGALSLDTTSWLLGSHTLEISASDYYGLSSLSQLVKIYIYDGNGNPSAFASSLAEGLKPLPVEGQEAPYTISNPRFSGVEPSSSLFTNGVNSGLQIEDGVLLTTGWAHWWNEEYYRPDTSESYDSSIRDAPELGDLQLEDRVEQGIITEDAAGLECDISSSSGQIDIKFQFGSEEYLEYIGSAENGADYNDSLLLTIDNVPISLVPDGTNLAELNTIHPFLEGGYPISKVIPEGVTVPPLNEHLYIDNELTASDKSLFTSPQVEYDGISICMHTHVFISPDSVHLFKAAIADVGEFGDDSLDSGIFIKLKSRNN